MRVRMLAALWSASILWAQWDIHAVATGPSDQDYPAVATSRTGSGWAAWVDSDGQGDSIQAAPLEGGYIGTGIQMNEGQGDLHRPALAFDGRGFLWCVWSEQKNGNWDLYARSFGRGNLGPIERLTTHPFPDTQPVMTTDTSGRVWLAWQGATAAGGKTSQILLRSMTGGKWGSVIEATHGETNAWEPALAADSRGGLLLAWDSYENGKYDVFISRYQNNRLSPARALTGDLRFHARPSVAIDAQDRAWVAWEEGSEEWGKDAAQMTKGLHSERRVRLAVVDGENLSTTPGDPTAGLPAMTEYAHVAVDGRGRVWLLMRVNTNQQIWRLVARSWDGASWSAPVEVEPSAGRQAVRVVSARDAEGALQFLWATDRRQGPFQAADNDIHYGRAPLAGPAPNPQPLSQVSWPAVQKVAGSGRRTWPESTLRASGKSYRLLWGEMHRHTDVNHHGRPDGALEDAYRYARDSAVLDFFASTEHIGAEPLAMGLNPMTWWRIQKYCDLMRVPGVFQPVYGYERSMGSPGGHKNIFFTRRGGPLVGTGDLPPYLWKRLREAGVPSVTIPHQLTGPAIDWQFHDPEFQPVMEIYQGRRQNYEYDGAPQPPGVEQAWGKKDGSWAWDALARGRKMGFIASSDHFSTHMSYAAVYAEEFSPRGILDAIKARRTYAASDNIVLDYRAVDGNGAEHLMGEAFVTARTPRFRIRATGTDVVEKAEIVRNGRFVHSQPGEAREIQFEFQDGDPLPGEAYYYVRLRQRNGQMAWSSPIWVTLKP